MNEEWRPVFRAPWSESYSVSSLGRVRNDRTGRILSLSLKRNYLGTRLSHSNNDWTPMVARLVAEAFVGKKPHGWTVNHKDGNRLNNVATNLEWVTPKENRQHASRLGLNRTGERHPAAKLTAAAVLEIRGPHVRGSIAILTRKYGISSGTVNSIRSGRTWKHLGRISA